MTHVHKISMTPHHPQALLWLRLLSLSLSLVLLLLGLWSRQ